MTEFDIIFQEISECISDMLWKNISIKGKIYQSNTILKTKSETLLFLHLPKRKILESKYQSTSFEFEMLGA